jgi:N-acetyl-alpha-D-glucosaminyl L-malate synthase BshA
MNETLRIGITCYPSFGGSGIIATELGQELARRGHQVHFICTGVPRRFIPEAPNVFLHEVKPPDYPLFRGDTQYAIALASRMVEAARTERLDLFHVHYAIPHATAGVLAKQILGAGGPKLITTLHGTDITVVGSDPSFLPVTRFSIEQSDGVSTPSRFLKEVTYEKLGIPRSADIEVISDFVDTDLYVPGNPQQVLVHNSNFRPLKRVEDVIRIFALVRQRMPCRLVLIGDGPERPKVEDLVAQLRLRDDVTFLGERVNVVETIQQARVFLLPSETESFGLAALEALSCGVPVVASRVGGLPEVVEEGESGFLVPVGDIDAMARAAVRLLEDDTLHARMSGSARTRAVERFRLLPMVDRYEAFYRRVLTRARDSGE